MHYSFFLTVSPDNDVDNPALQAIKLGSGILREVKISFPSGCNGVVRCFLANDSVQLLPTNQDGYYALDGDSVVARLWYDLSINTNTLYFIGWSVDADYSHELCVMLDVKEDNEPDMTMLQSKIIDVLDHLVSMIKSYL